MPNKLKELVELRTHNSKHFLNDDGSKTAEISITPIHYKDENGKWQDIDLSIVDESTFDVLNTDVSDSAAKITSTFQDVKNDVKYAKQNKLFNKDSFDFQSIKLPYKSKIPRFFKRGYSVGKGNDKLTFIPVNANAVRASINGNKATYVNVWQDVDVELEILPNKLKETLTLKSSASPTSFSFEVEGNLADDLTAGTLKLQSAWLKDANGTKRDVTQTVRRDTNNGKVYLDMNADVSGLVYPVVIDPTVVIQPDATSGKDTELVKGNPSYSYGNVTFMNVGNLGNTDGDYNYTLIQFPLSSIPSNVLVNSATMSLYITNSGSTSSEVVEVHRITSVWDESTATWNNPPTYDSNIITTEPLIDFGQWHTFDLTSEIGNYINGSLVNNGWLLKASGAINSQFVQYVSSDDTTVSNHPKLTVDYIDASPSVPKVTFPNGGETLDKVETITWNASTDPNDNPNNLTYQIQLSTDNGSTWNYISEQTSQGTLQFMYDFSNEPETTQGLIRIRAYDGVGYGAWDESDSTFTILHSTPINFTSTSTTNSSTIAKSRYAQFATATSTSLSQSTATGTVGHVKFFTITSISTSQSSATSRITIPYGRATSKSVSISVAKGGGIFKSQTTSETTSQTVSIGKTYTPLGLGRIDKYLKPKKLTVRLAKPDGTIIADLNESYNRKYNPKMGSLDELSFSLPYKVEKRMKIVDNPHIDMLRDRYLLEVSDGSIVEWFRIDTIEDNADDKDIMNVHAFSLGIEIQDKVVRNISEVSKTATEIMNLALQETNWSVGYVDADFDLLYRGFDIPDTDRLNFLYEIAKEFDGVLEFDTINRKVNLKKQDLIGQDKGLTLTFEKYMKSVNKESDSNNIVTYLIPHGQNDLSLNSVSPTGASGIEDLSFFLYPFERDGNGNVIKSSYYMSDGLAGAILDYYALINSKQTDFDNLLSTRDSLNATLTTQQNDMNQLNTDMAIIQDNLDVQKANETYTFYNFTYTGTAITKTTTLDTAKYYTVMMCVSDTTNLTVSVDGTVRTLTSNIWSVFKLSNQSSNSIDVSGTSTNSIVDIYVLEITSDEFSTASNETTLLNKYNDLYKQDQIDVKQTNIDSTQSQLDQNQTDINNLGQTLSLENNFTPEQLIERNAYIIERHMNFSSITDSHDLKTEAEKALKSLNTPKTVIKTNIVNFLSIVEAQRDWDKLNIGDTVTVKYEQIGVNVKAKIIELSIDYEDGSIDITIANTKDIKDDLQSFIDKVDRAVSTSTTVDLSRTKWNGYGQELGKINDIINNAFDANARNIKAGVNNCISISGRGIIVTNPDRPNEMIIIQSGTVSLSMNGGQDWQTAITPQNIVAEKILGKLILSDKMTIGDANGILSILGDQIVITDNNDVVRTRLGQYATGKYGLQLMNSSGDEVVLDETGMLQTWQQGYADNVDSAHPISINIYIPTNALSVKQCILRFKLLAFRAYSKSTMSAGSGTVTSSSGGYVSTSTSSGGGSTTTSAAENYISGTYGHDHGIPDGTMIDTIPNSAYSGESVIFVKSGQHNHTVNLPSHSHNFTVPSHSHNVSIPSHTHDISYGIYEGGTPSGVGIVINGTDRTTDLGGSWSIDMDNLDITSYLSIGQWNTIELSSSSIGRIDATIFIQTFMGI